LNNNLEIIQERPVRNATVIPSLSASNHANNQTQNENVISVKNVDETSKMTRGKKK
jgi:hypothetical protein